MFGNGEVPPTATIATVPRGFGPVIDRLWSRAPRSGTPVPVRTVPTTTYPRPTRPLTGIFDYLPMPRVGSAMGFVFAAGFGIGLLSAAVIGAAIRRGS